MDSVALISPAPLDPAREKAEDDVALSYSVIDYESARYSVQYGAIGVVDHLWLRPGIELAAGGRFGFGNRLSTGVCVEGLASVSIVPHFVTLTDRASRTASWRPAVGIEGGLTSAHIVYASTRPPASGVRTDSQPTGGYFSFVARPFRFRFTRFNANILGVIVGTSLADPGRKLRVQLELVQIGWIL